MIFVRDRARLAWDLPVGFTGEIVADELLREGQYVTGANRNGWHLLGAEAGRDWQATTWADLRHVEEGDA